MYFAPLVLTAGDCGYLDMPIQVIVDSWHATQLVTPACICVAVGAGEKNPVKPCVVDAAFPLTNPEGVLAAWQASQVALLGDGIWDVAPDGLVCGSTTMLVMP